MNSAAVFALVAILILVGVVGFMVLRHQEPKECTPSDDEKEAAGGDGVKDYAKNTHGACVAQDCIEGYDLNDGTCSKAADINPYEGKSVTCKGDETDYFRVVDGVLRNYGSPEIATSWDPDWVANGKANQIEDCSTMQKGDPMALKQ